MYRPESSFVSLLIRAAVMSSSSDDEWDDPPMPPPASPEPSPGARDEAGPTEIGEHGAVASSSEEDEWSAAVADTEQPDPTRDGEGCSSVVASALIASPQKKPRRGRPPAPRLGGAHTGAMGRRNRCR